VTETEIRLGVKAATREGRPQPGTLTPSATREQAWWRDSLRRRILAVADLTAVLLGATVLASVTTADVGFWWACFAPAWIVLAKLHGLYDRDHRALRHLTADEIPALLSWATAGTIGGLLVFEALGEAQALSVLIWTWLTVLLSALVLRGLGRSLWRRLTAPEETLILGDGPLAEATKRKLELFPDIHAAVVSNADLSHSDRRGHHPHPRKMLPSTPCEAHGHSACPRNVRHGGTTSPRR
jgi:hypothetical protein